MKTKLIILGLIVLVLAGGWYYKTQVAGWETYEAEDGFSFKYPEEWKVVDFMRDGKYSPMITVTNPKTIGSIQPDELYISFKNYWSQDYVEGKFIYDETRKDSAAILNTSTSPLYLACAYYSTGRETFDVCNKIISTFKFTK